MSKKVHAFTITRAETDKRRELLEATIKEMKATAGHPFTLSVYVNTTDPKTIALLQGLTEIDHLYLEGANRGQHIPFNKAHETAREAGADYLLRVDDDMRFISKGWLRKLVQVSVDLQDKFILCPTIKGLSNPPPFIATHKVNGWPLKFVEFAIGGQTRLHPIPLLEGYVSDVRQPMGFGDATGIAKWAKIQTPIVFMAYIHNRIRVQHRDTTKKQIEDDPTYHKEHNLFQFVPYIPPIENTGGGEPQE